MKGMKATYKKHITSTPLLCHTFELQAMSITFENKDKQVTFNAIISSTIYIHSA